MNYFLILDLKELKKVVSRIFLEREFNIFGPVCLKVNTELVDGHFPIK